MTSFMHDPQVERHLPDLGPAPLQQHYGHAAALGAGLDAGHRPLQQVSATYRPQ